MKTFILSRLLLCVFLLSCNVGIGVAQSKKDMKKKERAQEVQKLISSKRFSFKVESAQPMRGGNIHVTSDYELELKKDTLNSYLPYFGRAFSAPVNPTESGLTFVTTEFKYELEKGKKGAKKIVILPKNRSEYAREFFLDVSESGYATLRVTANNRDPITYYGYITNPD